MTPGGSKVLDAPATIDEAKADRNASSLQQRIQYAAERRYYHVAPTTPDGGRAQLQGGTSATTSTLGKNFAKNDQDKCTQGTLE